MKNLLRVLLLSTVLISGHSLADVIGQSVTGYIQYSGSSGSSASSSLPTGGTWKAGPDLVNTDVFFTSYPRRIPTAFYAEMSGGKIVSQTLYATESEKALAHWTADSGWTLTDAGKAANLHLHQGGALAGAQHTGYTLTEGTFKSDVTFANPNGLSAGSYGFSTSDIPPASIANGTKVNIGGSAAKVVDSVPGKSVDVKFDGQPGIYRYNATQTGDITGSPTFVKAQYAVGDKVNLSNEMAEKLGGNTATVHSANPDQGTFGFRVGDREFTGTYNSQGITDATPTGNYMNGKFMKLPTEDGAYTLPDGTTGQFNKVTGDITDANGNIWGGVKNGQVMTYEQMYPVEEVADEVVPKSNVQLDQAAQAYGGSSYGNVGKAPQLDLGADGGVTPQAMSTQQVADHLNADNVTYGGNYGNTSEVQLDQAAQTYGGSSYGNVGKIDAAQDAMDLGYSYNGEKLEFVSGDSTYGVTSDGRVFDINPDGSVSPQTMSADQVAANMDANGTTYGGSYGTLNDSTVATNMQAWEQGEEFNARYEALRADGYDADTAYSMAEKGAGGDLVAKNNGADAQTPENKVGEGGYEAKINNQSAKPGSSVEDFSKWASNRAGELAEQLAQPTLDNLKNIMDLDYSQGLSMLKGSLGNFTDMPTADFIKSLDARGLTNLSNALREAADGTIAVDSIKDLGPLALQDAYKGMLQDAIAKQMIAEAGGIEKLTAEQVAKINEEAGKKAAEQASKMLPIKVLTQNVIQYALVIWEAIKATEIEDATREVTVKGAEPMQDSQGESGSGATTQSSPSTAMEATTISGAANSLSALLNMVKIDLSLLSRDFPKEKAGEKKKAVSAAAGKSSGKTAATGATASTSEEKTLTTDQQIELNNRRALLQAEWAAAALQIGEGSNAISAAFYDRAAAFVAAANAAQGSLGGISAITDTDRFVLFEITRGAALSAVELGLQASVNLNSMISEKKGSSSSSNPRGSLNIQTAKPQ